MTISDFMFIMSGMLFILGTISISIGLYILSTRVVWGDLKDIAQQTAQIAQKGIAEEISGLVGNASNLIESLNKLVTTAAGIGVALCIFGGVMIVGAFMVAKQLLLMGS